MYAANDLDVDGAPAAGGRFRGRPGGSGGAGSEGKREGASGSLYRPGGGAERVGDRRNLRGRRHLRRGENFGQGRRKGDVKGVSPFGADVWTPHVSD